MAGAPLRLHATTYDHPLHKRFFYPTTGSAQYHIDSKDGSTALDRSHSQLTDQLQYNSRRARKGRHALRTHHIQHHPAGSGKPSTGPATVTVRLRVDTVRSELKPHLKPDITFWLAVTFVLGSSVWVVNGFTVLLPLYIESIENSENLSSTYFKTASALAFVGGVIFEVGSYMMVVEALNRGRETGFGAAVTHLLQSGHPTPARSRLDHDDGAVEKGRTELIGLKPGGKGFVWWGTPLWRDLGYDAALIQLVAATIFLVSTITGLPGVIPGFPSSANAVIVKVFFWTPQVVGGTGFIVSALLLMIEVQSKWWLPNLGDLGWHISFWNLIGGIGFTLCGAMGYSQDDKWVLNSAISTFWGSCAFLIGSVAQMYEAVWREPEARDS